jgi:hypothetical protein
MEEAPMPHRKTLSRLAIASLAAASFAAPAAAQPTDMHASTVHKPTPAKVDLRGEAAADAAATPRKQDLRGEAAAAPAVSPVTRTPLPGPPTWPAYPTPLPLPEAPVVADTGGDDGIEVPGAILAIAGTLALGAGMALVVLRHRPRTGTAL